MIESRDYSEFAKSELASAVATVDLNEGNRRAAKKLFRESLALPTENSVAQAEWASAQVGELGLNQEEVEVDLNFEAKAVHAYRLGDWGETLTNCLEWLNDQPFSSRPANVLTFLYNTIFEKYDDALRIAEFGLTLSPDDRGLANNLAFTLINLGRLKKAEEILNRIDAGAVNDVSKITLVATSGMLKIREGHLNEGRALYQNAIEIAENQSNKHYAALACLNLALEEFRIGAESRDVTFKRAQDLASLTDEPDVRFLRDRLIEREKTFHEESNRLADASKRVLPS